MWRSPFNVPVRCSCIFMKVGDWSAGYHTGEDYVPQGNVVNPELVVPVSGTIQRAVSNDKSYGNYIVITTGSKCILMAHMKNAPIHKVGESVKAGEMVGLMGSTGNTNGAHLHIEVQNSKTWAYNKNLLKPSDYIDFSSYSNSEGGFSVKTYKNGSTKEHVYQTVSDAKAKKNSIGYLNTYETCECYGIVDGVYLVVYNTSTTRKTGFVNYSGGVK